MAIMGKMDIRKMTNDKLLDLYEDHIKCSHYDPTDRRNDIPFAAYEVRREVNRRMLGGYSDN